MAGIRVSRGIEVDVNDNGETIIIPVQDQRLGEKFYNMLSQIEQLWKDQEQLEKEGKEELTILQHSIEKTKELMNQLDEMFGLDCCRKVFGEGVIPGAYALGDFFDQMTPIIEQYAADRKKVISQRYNRNRKGGKRLQ